MRSLASALLLCVAIAATAAAQTGSAPPPALLQAVSATTAASADYAFDFELSSGERQWRARFDPSATPRLRLTSPAPQSLNTGERQAFERMAARMEGVPWCASERMSQAANVRLIAENTETATYAFQPTAEMIRSEQARPFANRFRGEFTIVKSDPDISRFRIFLPRAFSPAPLVTIERFDVRVSCAAAPNGRQYAAETISDVRGSAFGSAINEQSVQRAHNLNAAP
ncbi:MAG: hypothetical protein JNM59_09480 [Hyphomonadaceae bacterium]|nr:hypothetical protein [Hyphomonadaceae bacterium]